MIHRLAINDQIRQIFVYEVAFLSSGYRTTLALRTNRNVVSPWADAELV